MLDKLHPKIKQVAQHSFIKYLFVAAIIVFIEIGVFQLLNAIFSVNYLIATILSMLVGIILNWVASRLLVFKPSRHSKKKEFGMVFTASLVGVGIQSLTSFVSVGLLGFAPLTGKILAIGITFFWNYFIRSLYIYREIDV